MTKILDRTQKPDGRSIEVNVPFLSRVQFQLNYLGYRIQGLTFSWAFQGLLLPSMRDWRDQSKDWPHYKFDLEIDRDQRALASILKWTKRLNHMAGHCGADTLYARLMYHDRNVPVLGFINGERLVSFEHLGRKLEDGARPWNWHTVTAHVHAPHWPVLRLALHEGG